MELQLCRTGVSKGGSITRYASVQMAHNTSPSGAGLCNRARNCYSLSNLPNNGRKGFLSATGLDLYSNTHAHTNILGTYINIMGCLFPSRLPHSDSLHAC